MARLFQQPKLVVASHNNGKIIEISDLLKDFSVNIVSSAALKLQEPIEDGDSFIANAKIKALSAATASGLPALADDSGLCVHALNNQPGIYSARLAGPDKNFITAMEHIHHQLGEQKNRRAHFVSALALCWPDGHMETVEGSVHGALVWPLRGTHGFGYDPMFMADGYELTFGEMDPDQKHQISHRADAFKQLVDACFNPRPA